MSQKHKNPSYRSKEATKLSDAIEQMYDAYKIKGKADKTSIITSWEEIMGKTIASRTTKLFFKGDVLYVQLTSAPLKQELSMAKDKIMKLIEERVGSGTITDIIFR